ncbi:MAG: hypothetical protein JNM59_02420 [Hyphomonadaceae bacterium]|nr:hypothetical protein [Hyphomonadaceae bacterium]
MKRLILTVAVLVVAGCASNGNETSVEEAARAECMAQGIPDGDPMQQCIARMEETVRAAREQRNLPPPPRQQGQPPPR